MVHIPSESRNPSRIAQGQNKVQRKMFLITGGYAKQKAFIVGDKP